MNYCNLKFSCQRLAKQKETWFVTRKTLQKFLFSKKEHAYLHCKHIFFELFTIFQSSPSNNMKKIWEAGATTLDKIYWNFWIFSTLLPQGEKVSHLKQLHFLQHWKMGRGAFCWKKLEYIPRSPKFSKVPNIMTEVVDPFCL